MVEQQAKDDFDLEIEDDLEGASADSGDNNIEIIDDTPPEDRDREPMPKEVVEEFEKDELDEYSEKVKLRLKQAKKLYHDERREKERALREHQEAVALAQRVFQENQKLKQSLTQGEQTLVTSVMQATQLEAENAKKAYREAYEAGDSEKLLEAQEKLSEANFRLNQLRNYKPSLQDQQTDVNQYAEQPVVSAPRPDTKTLAWQERNPWWGNDEEMTASALGLHTKLVKQYGGDYAGTDEYWQTIDKTMRRRFPEYFGESEKQSASDKPKPANVVAPASRSTSPKKIVLTKSQVAIAKRLGITPEQYAQELKKMEG